MNGYKNKTRIYAIYKRLTSDLKVRGWKKGIPCKWKSKESWGSNTYIRKKIDFKIRTVKREKESYYTMMKGSIQEEDITTVDTYAPNIGAPKHKTSINRYKGRNRQ